MNIQYCSVIRHLCLYAVLCQDEQPRQQ